MIFNGEKQVAYHKSFFCFNGSANRKDPLSVCLSRTLFLLLLLFETVWELFQKENKINSREREDEKTSSPRPLSSWTPESEAGGAETHPTPRPQRRCRRGDVFYRVLPGFLLGCGAGGGRSVLVELRALYGFSFTQFYRVDRATNPSKDVPEDLYRVSFYRVSNAVEEALPARRVQRKPSTPRFRFVFSSSTEFPRRLDRKPQPALPGNQGKSRRLAVGTHEPTQCLLFLLENYQSPIICRATTDNEPTE